jgi:N6-adenosine-specific RNA methylase IME4
MTPNVLSRVLAFTGGASFTLDDQRPFSVVCADVPWPFKDSLPGASRGAEKNYDLLTIAEVAGFDFEGGDLLRHNVADDAILALWRVGAMVEEAYQVARAWGFVPKAEIVWCKRTKNGKRHFGMGRLVRGEHETAILATRGRYSQLIKAKNIRSTPRLLRTARAEPSTRRSRKSSTTSWRSSPTVPTWNCSLVAVARAGLASARSCDDRQGAARAVSRPV